MTPDRFRECLDMFHWTQRGFARVVDRNESTVRQWARGKVSIPPAMATWLEGLAAYVETNPVPERKSNAFKTSEQAGT